MIYTILEKLFLPFLARVFVDYVTRYEKDPEFRRKVDAVKEMAINAQTDQELLDASKELQKIMSS